jgi:hypothetical protein
MLAVVLFASALFFAGLSTKLKTRSARLSMLVLSSVVFVATLAWLAALPIRLTT